jgi:hypothetical protein
VVIGPEFNSVRFALVGEKVKMETKDKTYLRTFQI